MVSTTVRRVIAGTNVHVRSSPREQRHMTGRVWWRSKMVILPVILSLFLVLSFWMDEETVLMGVNSFRFGFLRTKNGASSKSPRYRNKTTTYTLLPFNESLDYGGHYTCNVGKLSFDKTLVRRPLPENLAKYMKTITTEIDTNVNILVLGDSIGLQFYDLLREDNEVIIDYFDAMTLGRRTTLAVSSNGKHVVAAWRITDLLLKEKEGMKLPSLFVPDTTKEGGWTRSRVELLRNQSTFGRVTYDTLLYRIPLGWQPLERITKDRIVESLELAHELAGIRTVILLTLPFIDHIKDPALGPLFNEKNQLVRSFGASYKRGSISGIDRIVVLDIAQLVDELITENLKHLDRNRTNSFSELCDFSSTKIAHLCARVPNNAIACKCDHNQITYDGIHVCPNIYAGRIRAATGCLLQCLYDDDDDDDEVEETFCADECNDKFMTLTMLDLEAF